MGTSTDGQLSYGILFEEGYEFPWDAEPFDGDMEKWWESVHGFVNPVESPWDSDGDYKPGYHKDSPEIDLYFKANHAWWAENPLPVELVNYCHVDYPMYLLATKHKYASRGCPEAIEWDWLTHGLNKARVTLLEFIEKYHIETEDTPKWYLSSYWG